MKQSLAFLWLAIAMLLACNNNKKPATAHTQTAFKEPMVQALLSMVQKQPNDIELRLQLVLTLDSLKHYPEALLHMDSLIMKDSLNYNYWFTKGQIQEHYPDTAGAIKSYKRAMRVYPNQDVLLALANLYAETKNEKALEICQRIDELKLGKEYDCYAAFFRAVYYARTNNPAKAIDLFETSIAFNYSFMDAYIEAGALYFEQKNFEQALATFELANKVNTTYANAYYWQGKCYEALNKPNNALANYQKAFALDKTNTEAAQAIKRLNK